MSTGLKINKAIFIILIFLARKSVSQDRLYLMDNSVLNVYFKGSDDFDLFYALDTIKGSKSYHVSKRNVAVLIKKNDESVFFKPVIKQNCNFEFAFLANSAYSGLPIKFDVVTGDRNTKYQTLKKYSPVNSGPNPLPGAYIGYNHVIGKWKRLKCFLNSGFSLVQTHFNYYSERHTNFQYSREKQVLINSLEVRALYLYLTMNVGFHINILKNLELDLGTGLKIPNTLQSQVSGYSFYSYSDKDVILDSNTTYYHNTRTNDRYVEGGARSTIIKLSYNFKAGKSYLGVFLGINFNRRPANNVANWMVFGLKYYPFKNKRF